MDIINSLKNSLLLVLLFLLPLHIKLEFIKIYIFPLLLIYFGIIYYLSYIAAGNILQLLEKRLMILAGAMVGIAGAFIFSVYYLSLILALTAILAFGSSMIDYSRSGRAIMETRSYMYTGLLIGIIFVSEYFSVIKIEYVFYSIAVAIIIFSAIFQLSSHIKISYRKTTIIKKFKRYVISISDIRRIRNGWALLYAILLNVLVFTSIAIVLVTVPVLSLNDDGNLIIYRLLGIAAISFLCLFLGSIINSKIYYSIAFVGIFPFLLLMGFIISIKNTEFNLITGFLMFPAIALFFPGYRKYFSIKFPGSEIYYVNKFANFLSWVFILPVPLILLKFISVPVYVFIPELIASMAGLILALKFTNYPEIISGKKHKN